MSDATTLRERNKTERSAPGATAMLELTVVHAPSARSIGSVLRLSPNESAVIGRRAGLELALEDARVSRTHVRFVWDPRAHVYRFADLGSANGTYLQGERCESGVLSSNDLMRLGDTLLVCSAPAVQRTFDQEVSSAARSTLPVLIFGETGVGKELLARRVHERSGRPGAFVPLNCAALPRDLATAELFGHTRGAFSGAGAAREGLLRAASDGTLFLDEVAELPREVQALLLRSLQERVVRPVGSDREYPVDVRVVCATNADLERRVAEGTFREDLLARLAHVVLRLQPLRQRRHEILPLARIFAPDVNFSLPAAEALLRYAWPRNVRQLRAAIESVRVLKGTGTSIQLSDLSEQIPRLAEVPSTLTAGLAEPPLGDRCVQLSQLLSKHSGNVSGVAREMGKPRSHVYRWMRNFRLSRAQFEK